MDDEASARDRNLFAEERRRRIVDMLSRESRVLVSDLSKHFGVSTATLRNDLRDLEAAGLLRRTHGGAMALETPVIEHAADVAQSEHNGAKTAIGHVAASLVEPGDVIFLDSGSTTLELIRAIDETPGLTFITNDATHVLAIESRLSGCNIVQLGGTVRNGFHYTIGAATVDQARRLSATKAFIATNAFSIERGFSTHSIELTAYKRTMIERSRQTIVLMDSSKFGTFAASTFAALDDIDTLVTDSGIPDATRARIEGIEDGPDLITA